MITITIGLIAIFWVALMIMQQYAGELIISPIMGFMFGALYDRETDDKVYHTFQLVLLFVAFTFTWETDEQ
jgi:uncharacterized membrane protein